MATLSSVLTLLCAAIPIFACEDCQGDHVRSVKRMQPDAQNATVAPRGPLVWGQLNFLHTTDTHGWLEGHIKKQNYGADWGDFVSFTHHMKHKAGNLGVDLLLVDAGDLHDGNGLSDASSPNGAVSNPIFENIDYDLLTIGIHELYVTDIAYETFNHFSKVYGERYLTSNVQIRNNNTGEFEYIGNKFRYFTTAHGLRIMSFGVLYDFTGNSNVSKVIKTADLVKQNWFLDAIQYPEPIDLFLVIGHNPVRPSVRGSTFGTIYKTIRAVRPDIPIQAFGGHTHIRDFAVFDDVSTGLESGRYCETVGWLSVSGINSSTFHGNMKPRGVPNPTRPAIKAGTTNGTTTNSTSTLLYQRRYLDFNRLTFAFHAVGSQDNTFEYHSGERVTDLITGDRKELNLTALYGCAPTTYCQSCRAFGVEGSVRFDLVEGPFTFDDSFIVSPFTDAFQFLPNVPYSYASQVLDAINAGPADRRRDLSPRDFGFSPLTGEVCPEGKVVHAHDMLKPRSEPLTRGLHRRQTVALTPGYTTTDDFGTDGDDTIHSEIPFYSQPDYFQANASFPDDGSEPTAVDLIVLDFIATDVLAALKSVGFTKAVSDVSYYLPENFTTNSYLPAYAKIAWQANVPNCPVGAGVGSGN